MNKNDLVKDMDFVMGQLHTEWERSGKTKREVVVDKAQMAIIMSKMAVEIEKKQEQLKEELTFRQSMELSHENYILLRTVKKFVAARKKLDRSGAIFARIVLDKEEMKAYQSILPEEQEEEYGEEI